MPGTQRPSSADTPGGVVRRFDRSGRLRSLRDFDTVFEQGSKLVNRQLVVRLRPLPAGSRSRLGLSVSRKVGNAPRRNRVKRCLRAAWREVAPSLTTPVEAVLIARPQSAPDSLAAARAALADILARHDRRRGRDASGLPPSSGASAGEA